MRKNFGAKTWIYPQPVLILATYDENNVPNAMAVGWGGVGGEKEVMMSISSSHKTAHNLKVHDGFTVSIADERFTQACDYIGIVSGYKNPDKLAKAGFHTHKSEFVDAPVIDEFPLTLECRVISYDDASERLIGEIINTSADESILGADGKISMENWHPIVIDPVRHDYLVFERKVGKAFHDGLALRDEE